MLNKLIQILKKDENVPAIEELTTAPLSADQLEPIAQQPQRFEPPQLILGCARSVGQQREHNEDSLFTLSATVAGHSASMPFGVFIIADGMGERGQKLLGDD